MTRYDKQDAQDRAEEKEFRRICREDARHGLYQVWYSLGEDDDADDPVGSLDLLAEYADE